jgi:hypothetical protein
MDYGQPRAARIPGTTNGTWPYTLVSIFPPCSCVSDQPILQSQSPPLTPPLKFKSSTPPTQPTPAHTHTATTNVTSAPSPTKRRKTTRTYSCPPFGLLPLQVQFRAQLVERAKTLVRPPSLYPLRSPRMHLPLRRPPRACAYQRPRGPRDRYIESGEGQGE